MVAALRPSPFELLRRRVPARILARGEEYFASGAVLQVERGENCAHALVEGSAEEPYEVELGWSDRGVAATCTCPYDWSDVCKHAVALALALEPRQLAAPPMLRVVPAAPADESAPEDPIESAATRERELRARAGRSEEMRLMRPARGGARIFSKRTEREYPVLLGAGGFAWCGCPDFRTNELGTCKHVEHARRKGLGQARGPLAVLGSRDTCGQVLDPLSDVRLLLPKNGPSALERLVDEQGFVLPSPPEERLAAARRLRRSLEGTGRVQVRPEVSALIDGVEQAELNRRRFAKFEERVRASLDGKAAPPKEWARLCGGLRVELHPYQIDGVLFVARTPRALLADDMGLGKTVQSLVGARLLMELGEVSRVVIVCPASLKHQWRREIEKFFGETVEAVVAEGGRRAREAIYRSSRAPFVIMNYEVLIKDLPLVRALGAHMVIVDEAQRIKNWNTKTAKAVKGLSAPRALVLTGTPMENRLAELHSVVEYLEPRLLGPMWRLLPEFARTETVDKRTRLLGFRGLELIRARLAPHFLRRERSLVLSQLPERTDQSFAVPFTREQAGPYQDHAVNAGRIASKKHLTEADILRLMAELASMRMIANGLLLYEWEKVEKTVRKGELPAALMAKYPSPKLQEFSDVLEGLLGQRGTKVVVFSQWERMLRLAAAAARGVLEEHGARAVFFHGQLSSKARAEAIADFHDDPAARVFFSTDAGGVGLNLQEAASAVVHLEVPWNPAILEQRVGRVHRMGQRRPIQVVSLISEGCIESRIAQLVERKRALFDGLFKADSDEVRFDDESRSTLVEKVRQIIGDGEAAPSLPDEGLVVRLRGVDEETRQVKDGVAEIQPAEPRPGDDRAAGADSGVIEALVAAPPAMPPHAPPIAPPITPAENTAPEIQVDLGRVAQGLLGLFGVTTSAAAPASLPVTVRRQSGRIQIELPEVPEAAWKGLEAFVTALGSRPSDPADSCDPTNQG